MFRDKIVVTERSQQERRKRINRLIIKVNYCNGMITRRGIAQSETGAKLTANVDDVSGERDVCMCTNVCKT